MRLSEIYRSENISKLVGVSFVLVGIYLISSTDYVNAGIAFLLVGSFTAIVMNGGTMDVSTAISSLESSVSPLYSIIQDLKMEGDGFYIPPGGNLKSSRVFVPAGKNIRGLPDLYDEMTLVTGDAGRQGISLDLPGRPLYEEASARLDHEPKGMEGAREAMGMLTYGLGLAKSFSLREEDDDVIKLRLTHGRYTSYCRGIREESPGICQKTCCPLCSSYLMALAEATSKPFGIQGFDVEDEHVKFTLKVVH